MILRLTHDRVPWNNAQHIAWSSHLCGALALPPPEGPHIACLLLYPQAPRTTSPTAPSLGMSPSPCAWSWTSTSCPASPSGSPSPWCASTCSPPTSCWSTCWSPCLGMCLAMHWLGVHAVLGPVPGQAGGIGSEGAKVHPWGAYDRGLMIGDWWSGVGRDLEGTMLKYSESYKR